MKDVEFAESILELRLERIEEIKVRRDKPTAVSVLLVKARSRKGSEKEEQMQTTQLTLEPNIRIRLNNDFE